MVRNKRLLIGPAIDDRRTLESLVVRLAHYLSHVDVECIVVAITSNLQRADPARYINEPRLPPGIAPDVLANVSKIASKITLRVFGDSISEPADYVAFWDVRGRDIEPWRTLASCYSGGRTRFDVDWSRTRWDGIWFAELALRMHAESRTFDADEAERFRRRIGHLDGAPAAFLIGTGPSAREALDIDMSHGVRIVCNTTILDDELMEHVEPHIVTFADPVFHFGPSTYACQFQRALRRAAERHDFTIVTLERYAPLLRARFPQFAERIAGVRLGRSSWPQNYDLLSELAVKPFSNIMTMLMLPLASTFSRSIHLFGFDGRAARESSFWHHGPTVQLGRELHELRSAHPGFFDVDFADYYEQHVAELEKTLTDIEIRGGEIIPRSNSLMNPLLRRQVPDHGVFSRRPVRPTIVSITPDWINDYGHFGSWERAASAAAHGLGYEFRSLASRAHARPGDSVIPAFTRGTIGRDVLDVTRFEAELRSGLDACVGDAGAIVCFYTADIWHLPAILAIAVERPSTTFVVNLMRSHATVTDTARGVADSAMLLLRECLDIASGTNVHVCLDTDAIVSDLETSSGLRAPTWPMIMLGDPAQFGGGGGDVTPREPIRVVSPVHGHIVKGFPEIVQLAERLHGRNALPHCALTARFVPQPGGSTAEHLALARRFREAGGELISGVLTDAEYAQLLSRADVIVLPYRLATFRTRTSGVFLDAVAAGKPIVAVRGTWAGDLVERHGIGATYEDQDVDSLDAAIADVAERIDRLTAVAVAKRDALLPEFRGQRLIAFLAALASSRNAAPDPARVTTLRALTTAAADAARTSAADRETARIKDLVQIDDLQRERDSALDKVDQMRRMIEWFRGALGRPTAIVSRPSSAGAEPAADASTQGSRSTPRPQTLEDNVYGRPAGAHLDELALVAAIMRPSTRPDGVMVDVGANRGAAFRDFKRAGWTIYAFEPDQRHVAYLRSALRPDDRVILDERAVSNVTGSRVPFYVSEESIGISGLSAFRESHVNVGDVETVALKDVPAIERVDLLKIDTEGYERFVLEGFPWERIRPGVIVAEFEDAKTKPLDYLTSDLIGDLRDRGYQVWVSEWHPIVRYGIPHQWHRLVDSEKDVPSPDSWGNLVAFAQPVSSEEMGRALASVLELPARDGSA